MHPLPPRDSLDRHARLISKILRNDFTAQEVAALANKRLEQRIRKGKFSQIVNLPYEVSRLQQELD